MRKTLIITADFPPIVGGISDYSLGLAEGLAANKHEVTVLAIYSKQLKDIIRPPSSPFQVVPLFVSSILPCKLFQILWELHRLLKKNRFDQTISTIWFPCGFSVFLLKPFFRFKTILCVHGADILRASLKFKAKPFIRLIAGTADTVICNSRFTKDMAMKLLNLSANQVHVVNPGFNPQKYQDKRPLPISEIRQIQELELLCQNKKVLLTVARLTPSKGHAHMIDALPELLKKHPDLIYVIVGMSPPQVSTKPALIAQITSLGLTNVATIFDDISENFIKRAYELSTVFVMLSQDVPEGGYFEGFGIVYLEAGFFAKPVIGSRSGGTADAIVDTQSGFLIDPLDQTALVAKIDLLLHDADLARAIGSFGKKRVLERFFWEKIVRHHNELFL
jgi:phosphatidylinositol alpha-1,6-mannosyltransferase